MLKRVLPVTIMLLGIVCSNMAEAQTLIRSVVSSGGGTLRSGNLTLSFNIGESVAEFYTAADRGKWSIGFMQVDNEPVMPVEGPLDISDKLVIIPNPAAAYATAKLRLKDIPEGNYRVDIIDVAGNVLYTQEVVFRTYDSILLDLKVNYFKGGTYFIRIRDGKTRGILKLVKL